MGIGLGNRLAAESTEDAKCPAKASGRAIEQAEESSDEARLVAFGEFVLPHPNHPPAASAQRAVHAAIAGLVGRELLTPKRSVGLGLGRVLGAAVPEAAVDEDCDLELVKCEVGLSRQFCAAPPAGDAMRSKDLYQLQLGGLLLLRSVTYERSRATRC